MPRFASLAVLLSLSACNACSPAKTTATHAAAPSAASQAPVPIPAASLPSESTRPEAPGFDGATAWLNVDHPVTQQELRGKVVVVDFWTSCCINCIQTLPTLAAIEKRFADQPVAVLGVHSPKFDAETERDRLRAAIQEYSIEHPVAIDGSMNVWNRWGVQGWPTLFVLDAKGRVVWSDSGEPDPAQLASVIEGALEEGKAEGALVPGKLAGWRPEALDATPLAYPGKAIPLAGGGTAVADTGHHRIVLLDENGHVADVVGSGLAGNVDGSYGEASFKKPQGLAENGDVIYVADTENHEVRAIDRRAKTVSTVAGTGELGGGPLRDSYPARGIALRSPWDLAFIGGKLYVALAGSHQIGVFDPKAQTLAPFAGNGREQRRDGTGTSASFAQPSGLATDGKTLWVADSETSSVRAVDLASAEVKTVVGKDLFVFGDVDGDKDTTRLQHPIGIAWGAGSLWIADTYNSKVKKVDPATGRTTSFVGGAKRDQLFEPAGLFVRGDRLVVVDTHHSRLADFPVTGGDEHVWAIDGLSAPASGISVARANDASPAETLDLGAVEVAPSGPSLLHVRWSLPTGTGVNEQAPFKVRWTKTDGLVRAPDAIKTTGDHVQEGFDVSVTPAPLASPALEGALDMVVCDVATHQACKPVRRAIRIALRPTGEAHEADLRAPLPAAK